MTMPYPNYEAYRKLYARYLDKRPASELVDLVDVSDKTVVDLCCGEGEISKICLERGAKRVYLVDFEENMIDQEYFKCQEQPVHIITKNVLDFISNYAKAFLPPLADVIFCRQGVNYWFASEIAEMLPCIMKPGAVFVFNTFNKKPSKRFKKRRYNHNGHEFLEVSWLVVDPDGDGLDYVRHIQSIKGNEIPPHTTKFPWISQEKFHDKLKAMSLQFQETVCQNTSIYVCKKIKKS